MSSPHDSVDWELFDRVVCEARQAGVDEATIRAEVAKELADGEDWLSPFSLKGRLSHFTQSGHGPRPPEGESPTRPRIPPPHEW
jgi:hypothetical protein